jgi:hypothetical protein
MQCDGSIYKNGSVVGWLSGQSDVIEAIVVSASSHVGIKMDWHYIGGRACVKTLGNVEKATTALKACMPELLN